MTRIFAVAVASLLLAGCATQQTASNQLDPLRADFAAARNDPGLAQHAPVHLREAEQSLAATESSFKDGGWDGRTQHLAFVSQQKLAYARAKANESEATARRQALITQSRENQIAQLSSELEAMRRETPQGTVFTLGDVLFETGQSTLSPGAQQRLAPLADYLRQNPERQIIVEGHTDAVGSERTNAELSQRRAEAVRDFLASRGVEPSRLIARGMGEGYPVASNDNSSGRLQNRRVEVTLARTGPSTAQMPGSMR